LYNILIEFEETMNLARMLKLCLNGTRSKVSIGINLQQTSHYTRNTRNPAPQNTADKRRKQTT
jgi:hypothetical protein